MNTIKIQLISIIISLLIFGCGGTASILSTPIENIDDIPLKVQELTEAEKHHWGHLDLINDTIPGMSVDKAYAEIIKNKKGKTVVVAVIDSGIDIDHEDLDDVIWTNEDEIPNNGKDDDNNGYIDDIYGWNFLGKGYNEQLEYVRLLASGDTNHPDYNKAEAEYNKEYQKYTTYKNNYQQIAEQVTKANTLITAHLGKSTYTEDEVNTIETEDVALQQAINVIQYVFSVDMGSVAEFKKEVNASIEKINDRLNYKLNKLFKGRVTGDDPDDINDTKYGDNNVKPVKKSEAHGTHVAGIIAAERNNKKGVNGVANHVKIMSLRAVPNGDEYDKDVALAIRYAVDNGASIINTSFGKYYSPHSDWVRDAIAYAGKNDVLIVNAAGNESYNLDENDVYPNDAVGVGPEVSNTFISVGALEPKYGSGIMADFSNYGKINVDVFAPGAKVYSTTPENEYDTKGGTSMAAPAVAGVAALIRSYYPERSAAQVKQVLMISGLAVATKVIVAGNTEDIKPFADLTRSGKIVNAYNALIMASKIK